MNRLILIVAVIATVAGIYYYSKEHHSSPVVLENAKPDYDKIKREQPWVWLDLKIFDKISQLSGVKLSYAFPDTTTDWKHLLAKIKDGKIAVTGGAVQTAERTQWAYFSEPYRVKEDVVYVRSSDNQHNFSTVAEFLNHVKSSNLKVGIISSFVFATPELHAAVRDPVNKALFVEAASDIENLAALRDKKIDAIITNRLRGSQMVELPENKGLFQEYRINAIAPVHFIISKKLASQEEVDKLNKALDMIAKSGWLDSEVKQVPGAY